MSRNSRQPKPRKKRSGKTTYWFTKAGGEALGPRLDAVLDIPEVEGQWGGSDRGSLLQELGFTTRHGLPEPVVTYLAGLGRNDERHRETVLSLLADIDHPIAVGHVARELAAAEHRAKQSGGFSLGSMLWGDRLRRRDREGGQLLSAMSLAELRLIWEDQGSPDWMQDYAFTLWSSHVRDLAALQAVPEPGRYFRQAVWQRELRGDRGIVLHVLAYLAGSRRWLHVLAPIWRPEVEAALDAILNETAADPALRENPRVDAHHTISHLLRDIPAAAAERLLSRHWSWMGRIPLLIQMARYHGTPTARALAEEALISGAVIGDPFEHVDDLFGFFTQGLM